MLQPRLFSMKKILLLSVLLTSCYLLLATKAEAQDISLGIYPPIIQIDAMSPSQIHSPFTIINQSDSSLDVHLTLRQFASSLKDNGEVTYLPENKIVGPDPNIFGRISIFNGIDYAQDITLSPLQKKNMELQINLPREEPPGDYYFSIITISKPITSSNNSNAAVSAGISTNVLLSIGPKDPTDGYIKEFSSPFFLDHGPLPFTLRVANTSNHFIYPTGRILIRNIFNQTIGKVDLRQDNILAGSSRYLTDDNVKSSIPIKLGSMINNQLSIIHPMAFWNEKFLFGLYSARLTISLSDQGPIFRRTIYFFAIPFQILLGIFLCLILLAIVIMRVKKKL